MQHLLVYLLKAIICSGIFWAYYYFVLRDRKFHYYNRFYLLTTSVLTLGLPLVKMPWLAYTPDNATVGDVLRLYAYDAADMHARQSSPWQVQHILYLLIGLVGLFFVSLLCLNVWRIIRIKHHFPKVKMEQFTLVETDLAHTPFSWFANLFWRTDLDMESETGRQILEHEMTHIYQKHSWDKLYFQLLTSLFWMNPFFWRMQKELAMIHEFIADEKALEGKDASDFAAMLLQAQFGNTVLATINPFALSPIKRRIAMFTSSSNPRYNYLRRLLVLPAAAVALVFVSFQYKEKIAEQKHTVESKIEEVADKVNPMLDSTVGHAIAALHPNTPSKRIIAEKAKLDTPPPNTEPVFVRGNKKWSLTPLFIVDGDKVEDDVLKRLVPDQIQRIDVLKDKTAIEKYGEDGKNGVIIITRKPAFYKMPIPKDSIPQEKNAIRADTHTDDLPAEVTIGGLLQGKARGVKIVRQNTILSTSSETGIMQAHFPDGHQAFQKFLEHNLNVDLLSEKGAPAGNYTIKIRFKINKDGSLSQFKVLNDSGYGAGAEALRVIQLSPKWASARIKGKKIDSELTQNIIYQVTE